jgi:hypothetical protein
MASAATANRDGERPEPRGEGVVGQGAARNRGRPARTDASAAFAEIIEILIHQGHSEADLWNCSPDKLRLLYQLFQARMIRDSAIQDLRQLGLLRAAIASALSKDGQSACAKIERALRRQIQAPFEKV